MTQCISQWKIQIMTISCCYDSLSIQAETRTRLKVSAGVVRRKGKKFLCSIFKAAAFVLVTLALVQAL